jgi:hypothetical protein
MKDVGISRTYFTKKSAPYSSCVSSTSTTFSSTYFTYTKNVSSIYSQQICNEFCMQFEFIKPNCSCNDPSVFAVTTDTICSNLTQLDCVDAVRNEFNSVSLADTCDEYCPEECDKFTYSHAG